MKLQDIIFESTLSDKVKSMGWEISEYGSISDPKIHKIIGRIRKGKIELNYFGWQLTRKPGDSYNEWLKIPKIRSGYIEMEL